MTNVKNADRFSEKRHLQGHFTFNYRAVENLFEPFKGAGLLEFALPGHAVHDHLSTCQSKHHPLSTAFNPHLGIFASLLRTLANRYNELCRMMPLVLHFSALSF